MWCWGARGWDQASFPGTSVLTVYKVQEKRAAGRKRMAIERTPVSKVSMRRASTSVYRIAGGMVMKLFEASVSERLRQSQARSKNIIRGATGWLQIT